MTAHWANHCCALCFARTVAGTPAVQSWPYMPICRASNEEARSKIRSSISAPVLDCGRHRESCRLFRERAREACRASTSVGELRRVDNAKPDRKSHKPRRPNRRALMPVDLSRNSEISSHGFSPQLQIFLRPIVVKLRFRPRSPCNLMRHRAGVLWFAVPL